MQTRIKYLKGLIDNGGPMPEDYAACNDFFIFVHKQLSEGSLSREEVRELWRGFDPVFSRKTLQGFVCEKLHGYAGDFEIIDKIYQKWLAPEPELANWDRFFHWQAAPKAVRNRKRYFIDKFSTLAQENGRDYQVLNVCSGPARDLKEFFTENPAAKMSFDCVDMDENAIAYAKDLCRDLNGDRISFHHSNIFRFKNEQEYDLIWSAGLFDYLDEKKFSFLLARLLTMLKPGGKLIIGNFTSGNDTRQYMEFGEWYVNHRSPAELKNLALNCNIKPENIEVEQEPEGVNLFLVVES